MLMFCVKELMLEIKLKQSFNLKIWMDPTFYLSLNVPINHVLIIFPTSKP
jgi:hypothetical protein